MPDGQPGVEVIFDPGAELETARVVRRTSHSHIDIIPASPSLTRFDLTDQKAWEQGDLHLALRQATDDLRPHYDLVLCDCPPRLSLVSFAALCASDAVIIPLEAADWGAQGIMQVTSAIEYVQRRFHPDLTLLGYLASRFKKSRSFQQAYLERLGAHFGERAFDTVIPDLATFEKSVTARIPLTLYAPRSAAAGYARALFDEVERRLGASRDCADRGRPDVRQESAVVAR
jgi:chromosome partitioning protein